MHSPRDNNCKHTDDDDVVGITWKTAQPSQRSTGSDDTKSGDDGPPAPSLVAKHLPLTGPDLEPRVPVAGRCPVSR